MNEKNILKCFELLDIEVSEFAEHADGYFSVVINDNATLYSIYEFVFRDLMDYASTYGIGREIDWFCDPCEVIEQICRYKGL